MFELKAPESFWWDAEIPMPGGETATIHVQYRYLSKDKRDELTTSNPNIDASLAGKVLLDWEGVMGGDGEPLPCNQESLDAMTDIFPGAPYGLWLGYSAGIIGLRKKN